MSNHSIIGILDCKSKTIYGINKNNNNPYVLFRSHKPDDGNFIVSTKLKYTNKNHYCVVKFLRHDTKFRFPIATIVYILGKIEEDIPNYEYILHTHNLNFKQPQLSLSKNKMKKFKNIDNIWNIINKNHIPTYRSYIENYTFSIDPKGSTDIDDAFSFRDNYLGIHIADVSFWLKFFNFEPSFYSTIYLPHRKINMIPQILSDNLASLLEKKDRLALTLWINLETGSFYYEDTIIRVDHNFTYDNFDTITNKRVYELSKQFGKLYNMDIKTWDSHKMVEAFMILANHKTAEYLHTHKLHLFRVHTQKEHNVDINSIQNTKFKEFMRIYLSNSAEYTNNPGKHYSLNLELYTHFTSPIRRMADLYVHYLIRNQKCKINFDKLNSDIKQTKLLKRNFEKFDVLKKLRKPMTMDGFIVNYNGKNFTVYFPKIDFCDTLPINKEIKDKDIENELYNQRYEKIKKVGKLGKLQITLSKKNNNLVYNIN
jgi:exoribonuclease R